jgi:hypothetical protein
VELPEAAAVWLPAARQADADRRNEDEQERERTERTPPRRRLREERHRYGEFREGEQDRERAGEETRRTEVADGLP